MAFLARAGAQFRPLPRPLLATAFMFSSMLRGPQIFVGGGKDGTQAPTTDMLAYTEGTVYPSFYWASSLTVHVATNTWATLSPTSSGMPYSPYDIQDYAACQNSRSFFMIGGDISGTGPQNRILHYDICTLRFVCCVLMRCWMSFVYALHSN